MIIFAVICVTAYAFVGGYILGAYQQQKADKPLAQEPRMFTNNDVAYTNINGKIYSIPQK